MSQQTLEERVSILEKDLSLAQETVRILTGSHTVMTNQMRALKSGLSDVAAKLGVGPQHVEQVLRNKLAFFEQELHQQVENHSPAAADHMDERTLEEVENTPDSLPSLFEMEM